MELDSGTARIVSAWLLRLHARSVFFTALALYARFEVSFEVPTAATDGRTIFINPRFFDTLTPEQRDAVLTHEVLHAALLHVPRRGGRDGKLWNVAADIVVNGMLAQQRYELPAGGLRDKGLEHLSVEEVYEKLLERQNKQEQPRPDPLAQPDLLEERPADAQEQPQGRGGLPADARARDGALERHWQKAHTEAATMAGSTPAGLARERESLAPATLDWRSHLWRYLTHTPTDFQDFDRRFVGRGLYLETIAGESLQVLLAVDTSGSINQRAVSSFLDEVRAILRAYPHLRCDLYYADAALYGPHRLTARSPIPPIKGGGGTDFRPFFARIPTYRPPWQPAVAIYMTDGHGTFPKQAPRCPVLWVVTPGGRGLDRFPFGRAVRLLPGAPRPR